MLDARVQSHISATDNRKSVFSPLINSAHHCQAQLYHDLAIWYCRNAHSDELKYQAPAILAAYVLIAFYHHASTNHLNFRLAVTESVQFVVQNRTQITDSPSGPDSLQMWFRLCTSHRPAKPPALLLEGQGASSFGPNLLPDVTEHLYLNCVLGMGENELIYDILIKTLEIRTKLVVFHCVAQSRQISESSSEVGTLAHEVLNKMLGRKCAPEEYTEAQEGFVHTSHLLGLLDVQKERLKVWKARFSVDQLPTDLHGLSIQHGLKCDAPCFFARPDYSTHRDTMNALYCLLCEAAFEQSSGVGTSCQTFPMANGRQVTAFENIAHTICQIADMLDFTISSTADVYTLSLAEVLLQLVLLGKSDEIFHHILDVVWPQLEMNGKGYEHSHYPTHLVKRIIAQVAVYWKQGRTVTVALPAVPEEIPKFKLLDIDHPVNLVVCGFDKAGQHFIEKFPLP
ncbi:uncharacterized protein N7459_009572 [Penicillium hispanicum]|uniref:uncharacterized protein n=1 Tax=Penicillium hispanicum TaxID=1080232 RepID=UPI0025425D18|nr:uncharacterized protein N7459_009572 [Penicillium hispanicum]KAJ5570142.1 hypothetical protein N7459_009572 [Penicillium hispanicum]